MRLRSILLLVLCSFWVTGCVLQKKYDELQAEKDDLAAEMAALEENLSITEDKNKRLEKQLEQLKSDTSKIGSAYRKSSNDLRKLETEHKTLKEYYNDLQQSKGALDKDLADKQNELLNLETHLALEKQRNDDLYADLQEREAKVAELEKILEEKDQAVNALKNSVSNALLNFKENDLTVEVRNGKVYVSLAEQLLFKSGSIELDDKGKSALKQLAGVLKTEEDIFIMVEGHTDNVRISKTSQYMKDNWDLSVLRSTSIIRILTREGVPPQRISAAGKGEFNPVAANSTRETRRKNRRTEIILTPRLDELFKILE